MAVNESVNLLGIGITESLRSQWRTIGGEGDALVGRTDGAGYVTGLVGISECEGISHTACQAAGGEIELTDTMLPAVIGQ